MPDWPHSPIHRLSTSGTYLVTAATYLQQLRFLGRKNLDHLQEELLAKAKYFDWEIESWSVFPNHYHFIATGSQVENFPTFLAQLHSDSARWLNEQDESPGRRVWYQYWESQLTYEKSYLARLNYVHHNPVHHNLVRDARQYPWCSAAWFEQYADPAFYKTVCGFKTDRLRVKDFPCPTWEESTAEL